MADIEAAAREFVPAVEELLDWMNGNDLSADHAQAQPESFDRLCKALKRMRAALTST